jgi:hypothetical protein
MADGEKTDGRQKPKSAQHDPENAQGAQVSGKARRIAGACGSNNPASALGAKVVVWLQWSPATIAKHLHTSAETPGMLLDFTSSVPGKFHRF